MKVSVSRGSWQLCLLLSRCEGRSASYGGVAFGLQVKDKHARAVVSQAAKEGFVEVHQPWKGPGGRAVVRMTELGERLLSHFFDEKNANG